MRTALMVAEKPSLAQALAQILSHGKMKSRKGINNVCSVHEYEGFFKNEPTRFKVTSVCGHVKSLDFISKFNNWDTVDPIELFEAPAKKKEANPELRMPQHLQREALGCDYLILWLDCDKEGENICFEVIQIVLPHLKQWFSHNKQAIFRAKFSAVAERDLREAMSHLGEPNENESRSVDARQELDLRIGCAFTRFQTKYFQGKYSNLDSSLISFGPCQTPTLGFCVDRYDQIQNFKAEPYWILHVQIKTPGNKTLTLDWHHGAIFDVEVARFYLNSIKDISTAIVTSIKSKECVTPRPQALNTVELMRVASSGLGIGSHQAMQIAERLYTQGYISYPRTETTHYPDSFDHKEILGKLRSIHQYSEIIQNLNEEGVSKPRKGHDAGDHPPITPMKAAHRDDLEVKAWKIYDYIARHFIATVSHDMVSKQTTATLEIGPEKFTCSGIQVLEPGYTKVFPWQAPSDDDTLPPLNEGDSCSIKEMRLDERQTQPPEYLTEAELITQMEKHGIGTDASIPVHINNICERHYVTVESGRRLVPTTLGIVLVHSYKQIDPELVLPTMRAAVEKQLNLIAQGKADHGAVLRHTLTIFLLKFIYFVTSISEMNDFFSKSFTSLADSGKPFTRCGKCRRYLKLITNPTNKLHCQNCRETLSLPRGGNLREYKEFECPLDDYQLIQWSGGSKGKSFILCPYCYNHPPFEDMLLGNGCNNCSHPDCPHSLATWSSISCASCPHGIFVLDAHSGPPNWKLSCNRCDAILFLCEGATKLKVDQNQCSECLRQLFAIEYKKENTKLPNGKTKAVACPFCEPELSSLVNFSTAQKAQQHRPHSNRGRGGRRRGPRQ